MSDDEDFDPFKELKGLLDEESSRPDEPLKDIRYSLYQLTQEALRAREGVHEVRMELIRAQKLMADIRWWIVGGVIGIWAMVAKLVFGW